MLSYTTNIVLFVRTVNIKKIFSKKNISNSGESASAGSWRDFLRTCNLAIWVATAATPPRLSL